MRAVGLVMVSAVLACAACDGGARLDGLADAGVAKVASAVDGDTVRLEDGREIDLAGVAAPVGREDHAGTSRAALQAAVGGREVRLLHGGAAEGPYHLRDARSRAWVQADLLKSGAVRVRTALADRAMAHEMLGLEAQARSKRQGLWASADNEVRLPSEVVARRETGFVVVEGRVVRVAEQAGRVYLEFSRDWRGGFSAETPLADKPGFAAAGTALEGLQGRLVRIRGVVRSTAYGPRLALNHPEQIEELREPASR